MVKVKICGITRPQDIECINITKPDYIGFVFAPSRRKITPQQAYELRKLLHPSIIPVGVFVDESIESIIDLLASGVIETVQLHGTENDNYIGKLKSKTDKPVIKAIDVRQLGDTQKWAQSLADFLLLDHESGGTGSVFDWGLIGEVRKPYFLAGGLSSENIHSAISLLSPYCVDVSSGVETDGIKNAEKIAKFIQLARGCYDE